MSKKSLWWLFLICTVLGIGSFVFILQTLDITRANNYRRSSPMTSILNRRDIASVIHNDTPNVDIAVYDVNAGKLITYQTGSISVNYTASIVKLSILVGILHQYGQLSSEQMALAKAMMQQSDNEATQMLYEQLGSTGLQQVFVAYGMVHTQVDTNGRWGLTRTTASDQMKLMKEIFVTSNSQFLSDDQKYYVKSLMNSSGVNQSQIWGLPKHAPKNVGMYVKNGWLPLDVDGDSNAVINSLSYVTTKNAAYCIVVLSNEDNSQDAGFKMSNRVGQLVYNKFNVSVVK